MSFVPLSDEETYAIFTETFTESLADLGDSARQLEVLKRIHKLLASDSPRYYIYERLSGYDHLEIIRVGGDLRVFCRLVMGIPDGDAEYNILWCYYIDPHNYDSRDLTVYDATAREQTRKVGEYDDPSSVRSYLEENNAFTATDLKERIDRF